MNCYNFSMHRLCDEWYCMFQKQSQINSHVYTYIIDRSNFATLSIFFLFVHCFLTCSYVCRSWSLNAIDTEVYTRVFERCVYNTYFIAVTPVSVLNIKASHCVRLSVKKAGVIDNFPLPFTGLIQAVQQRRRGYRLMQHFPSVYTRHFFDVSHYFYNICFDKQLAFFVDYLRHLQARIEHSKFRANLVIHGHCCVFTEICLQIYPCISSKTQLYLLRWDVS